MHCNIKAGAIYLPLSRCCCSHKANLLSPPDETSKIKVAHVPFQICFFFSLCTSWKTNTEREAECILCKKPYNLGASLIWLLLSQTCISQRGFFFPSLFCRSYWFIICAFVILFLLLLLLSASSQWIFIFPLTHLYLNFLISCLFLFISVAWWFDHAVEYRISNLRVLGYRSRTPVRQVPVFFPTLTPSSVAACASQPQITMPSNICGAALAGPCNLHSSTAGVALSKELTWESEECDSRKKKILIRTLWTLQIV